MNWELDERCPSCFERVPPGGACANPLCLQDAAERTINDLPLGVELNDQFRIGRILGRGGFGITYLAWDQRLARRAAVKECFPSGLVRRSRDGITAVALGEQSRKQFAVGREMFLREARLLAQFHDQPGIVSVLSVFEENETAYLVMEFLHGHTLKEYLEAQPDGRVAYERALALLTPTMHALSAVHEHQLLHRDVSPDNIFLTSRGAIKLLDFGAARYLIGQQTRSLPVILKEGYTPPEQYSAKGQQGTWTDVYALAATFYRALTGQVPPPSLDRLSVEEDELLPPSRLGISLPADAEAALMRALSARHATRTRRVDELLDALTAAHEPPLVQPPRVEPPPAIEPPPPGPVTRHESILPPPIEPPPQTPFAEQPPGPEPIVDETIPDVPADTTAVESEPVAEPPIEVEVASGPVTVQEAAAPVLPDLRADEAVVEDVAVEEQTPTAVEALPAGPVEKAPQVTKYPSEPAVEEQPKVDAAAQPGAGRQSGVPSDFRPPRREPPATDSGRQIPVERKRPARQRRAGTLAAVAAAAALAVAAYVMWPKPESPPPPPPIGSVVLDAVPWATVVQIVGEDGSTQPLPGVTATPLVVPVREGAYTITLEGPPPQRQRRELKVSVTGSQTVEAPVEKFTPVTVSDYFSRALGAGGSPR